MSESNTIARWYCKVVGDKLKLHMVTVHWNIGADPNRHVTSFSIYNLQRMDEELGSWNTI